MELFSPSLKFFKEKNFLFFSKKNYKNPLWKDFLYFLKKTFSYILKMELSSLKIKILLIFQGGLFQVGKLKNPLWKNFLFFLKKSFSYIFLAPILKNSGGNIPSFKNNKILIWKNFLHFLEKNSPVFWDDCWSSCKVKEIPYTLGWLVINW